MTDRTGAERYLKGRLRDPEYRHAYERSRQRIDQIDRVIRALDDRREELHFSKAELARRAEMPPEAVRRLFSAERPNPTLHTLAAIAGRARARPHAGAETPCSPIEADSYSSTVRRFRNSSANRLTRR